MAHSELRSQRIRILRGTFSRHFDFKNFHIWSRDCHRVPNFIKIGWFFVDIIWRFTDFKDGGHPPSWIFKIWSLCYVIVISVAVLFWLPVQIFTEIGKLAAVFFLLIQSNNRVVWLPTEYRRVTDRQTDGIVRAMHIVALWSGDRASCSCDCLLRLWQQPIRSSCVGRRVLSSLSSQ